LPSGTGERRQQNADEHGDDPDHHQQLDERETDTTTM
jgi:hypothetical protein